METSNIQPQLQNGRSKIHTEMSLRHKDYRFSSHGNKKPENKLFLYKEDNILNQKCLQNNGHPQQSYYNPEIGQLNSSTATQIEKKQAFSRIIKNSLPSTITTKKKACIRNGNRKEIYIPKNFSNARTTRRQSVKHAMGSNILWTPYNLRPNPSNSRKHHGTIDTYKLWTPYNLRPKTTNAGTNQIYMPSHYPKQKSVPLQKYFQTRMEEMDYEYRNEQRPHQ